jgi:tetratricopeptide (TPR) repeat protein
VIQKLRRLPRGVRTAAIATAVTGVLLVCVGLWLKPLLVAERALSLGELERAADQYAVGRWRLDRIPFLAGLFPGLDDLATHNELSAQYALRRYDRILEASSNETVRRASVSFWAGCALFDKALAERDREVRVGLMSQAYQAFRRALELAPDDWDTKFNYEVAARWLIALKEQPEASPQEIIKLLRQRGPQSGGGRRTG